jgi:hypothetical protein
VPDDEAGSSDEGGEEADGSDVDMDGEEDEDGAGELAGTLQEYVTDHESSEGCQMGREGRMMSVMDIGMGASSSRLSSRQQ